MAINKRELTIYWCKRCLWNWPGRKETAPETCPKCRSPYWNKERQSEVNNGQNSQTA